MIVAAENFVLILYLFTEKEAKILEILQSFEIQILVELDFLDAHLDKFIGGASWDLKT